MDTFNFSAIGSLKYNNELFTIYSDMENSYLEYYNGNELEPLDTLSLHYWWSYDTWNTEGQRKIPPISSSYMQGVILVENNNLTLVRFKRSWEEE
jgi:hypothetical protein